MSQIAEVFVCATIIIGAGFTLIASYGLLKLNSPMSRLHAPTKAGTLGVGSILASSIIYAFARGTPSFHEILIMAFLFVTAPISANFISKVAIHRERIKIDLPPPAEDSEWATRATAEKDPES